MISLFEPLPPKQIQYNEYQLKRPDLIKRYERVLFFDPRELYGKISHKINHHKRHAGLQMDDLFPKLENKCACGCDKTPKEYGNGNYMKWASDECGGFASDVLSIINNYFQKPIQYINIYYGHVCCVCNTTNALELDHIVGVKQGGGGCWLSNYRWVCVGCHRAKTNKDFGFKKNNKPNQIKLELP